MSCEFNAGRDAVVQLGKATTWGTKADATMRIPFTSEGLAYTPNYGEAEALIGNTLSSRMEILSEHVEGDIETYVTPDEIRLYLLAALGVEFEPVDNGDSTYTHYFVPVKSGGSKCLPILSAEVNRGKDIFGYDSLKVNSLSLSAEKEDYVMVSMNLVGHDETDSGSDPVASLTSGISLSSKSYFKFRGATVEYNYTGAAADTAFTEVSSIDFSWENNIPTDRYTTSGAGKLSEMNPQGRSATLGLTVYLSDVVNTLRKSIFKLGATMRVTMEFAVTDEIVEGEVYNFGLIFDNCYLTEVPYNIDSPDEISFDLNFQIADHDTVDFVASGYGQPLDGGTPADTISTTESTIATDALVRANDPDGFSRIYKYKGDDVTVAADTVTFTDSADESESEIEPIFSITDVFNSTSWEIVEGVVAYATDGDDSAL
jgi:hypothetical protein